MPDVSSLVPPAPAFVRNGLGTGRGGRIGSPSSVTAGALAAVDPELAAVIEAERARQSDTLDLIASENYAPRAVLEANANVLTNKYAPGYPGDREYGGCEYVDAAENLARERAKELYGSAYANVQPHSGAQANAAVMHALLRPGDRVLAMAANAGGHFTHGASVNSSGRLYDVATYGVDPRTFRIDMDTVRAAALAHRPHLVIAGWSAYPRHLDFAAFRAIADEVGAFLLADMAHFAGLVAAGRHPNPVPHAHVVTSTTHKTLGGPRGGLVLAPTLDLADVLDAGVFPGQQGGPFMHVIAGKAAAFRIAGTPAFIDRQVRTLRGAKILANRLLAADVRDAGVSVLTGGTDVHLVVVDLRAATLDGLQAEHVLQAVGITVSRTEVPFDPRPPAVTSGLRVGTPALATRGFGDEEFTEVADVIAHALQPRPDLARLRARVARLTAGFPLYDDRATR